MRELELMDTNTLLYGNYRYKHCDGDCDSCPCHYEGYRCSYINKEIEKELDKRELKQKGA